MEAFRFNTCKSIVSEPGALSRIAGICGELGMRRPLVVSDPGLRKLGMLEKLEGLLADGGCEATVFSEVVADPPERVVEQALQQARGAEVDGVIGFGGGSSLDTAKLSALLAGSGAALADIYGVERAAGPRLPLVLVPTTAGTGSEVTPVAIVTTGATRKTGVVSRHLLPDVVLLDAQLTLGLPPDITAMTGVDAMVHAVEAYTSIQRKNPYSDMLAREALRLLSTHFVDAVRDGANLAARQSMLLGACLAGQAFANAPVAAVHALAYPLGGHYHIPHGLSNALVLPHVLRFNQRAAGKWYAELKAIVDQSGDGGGDNDCPLGDYFIRLIGELGLPATLREMAVSESRLPSLAADAMEQQRLLVNNPRPLVREDALAIYRAAYAEPREL